MRIRKKSFGYLVLIILFVFQGVLSQKISIFDYYDELLAIVSFLFFTSHYMVYKRITKLQRALLFLILFFVVEGVVSNLLSDCARSSFAIAVDILSNIKLFLVAISFDSIKFTRKDKEVLSDYISFFIRVLFIVMALLALVNVFVDVGMSHDLRYGMRAFCFVYDNAATLNTYYYLFVILFSVSIYSKQRIRKYSTVFLIIGLFPWIMTLRTRAFAFTLLYTYLYFFLIIGKSRRIKWYHYLLAGLILFLVGYDTFAHYFLGNSIQTRAILMSTAFAIAWDYFPFGTGFATFGTQMSRIYYSDIYSKYSISNIWGLSESNPQFILDQYWFGIIGQFGIIGTIPIVLIIINLYKKLFSMAKSDHMKLATIIFTITTAVASITAATYIQASVLASIITIFLFREDKEL